jgi:signal transduction histidine kinase
MSDSRPPGAPPRSNPLRFLRRPGLTQQIFLFFVIPLTALLLLAAFGSQTLHQQAMRSMVGERDQRTARLAAQAIEAQLDRRAQAVRLLALRLTDGATPQVVAAASETLAIDFDGGLAVWDAARTQLAGQGALATITPTTLQDFPASAGPEPTFSALVVGPNPGERWVLVTASTPDQRLVVGAFSPEILVQNALGDTLAPPTGVVVYVIDAQRRSLYQSGVCTSSLPCTEHPAIDAAFQGRSGLAYIQTSADEHVVAYGPIPATRWAIIIEEPWQTVDSPSLRTTQYTPLALLVPALVLALATLLFGVRQIVQPLQALETRAADLAWGKFETIAQPVGGIAEIRRLQTELMHLAQKVRSAQHSLHSYIGAITIGQEEERRRLARELHDDTLQALIALNQRLQAAALTPTEPATATLLAELQVLAGQTIADLRRFTRALRPIYLDDLGLVAALEALAREMSPTGGVSIAFRQAGAEFRLPPQVELALYRLAQEALNNVAHHAQASQAMLTLAYDLQRVTLTVSDNGQGFAVPDNPAEFAANGHFGLLGMQERAELIGAQLRIVSRPDQGTQVTITVNR